MKKIVMGMLASAVATLFFVSATPACSSSVDCTKAACSGDPAPTAEAQKACEAEKSGACSSEYNDAFSCVNGEDICTNDKSDAAKGLAALGKCADKISAYQTCKQKNAGGDGG